MYPGAALWGEFGTNQYEWNPQPSQGFCDIIWDSMKPHIPVRPVRVASPYSLYPIFSIGLVVNMDTTTTAATIYAGVRRVFLQSTNISAEHGIATSESANVLFDWLSMVSQNPKLIAIRPARRRQPRCRSSWLDKIMPTAPSRPSSCLWVKYPG
jgi:hypothetical protein